MPCRSHSEILLSAVNVWTLWATNSVRVRGGFNMARWDEFVDEIDVCLGPAVSYYC